MIPPSSYTHTRFSHALRAFLSHEMYDCTVCRMNHLDVTFNALRYYYCRYQKLPLNWVTRMPTITAHYM